MGNKTIPSMANKPELIIDYNFGKKGVDQLDKAIEEFSCRWKTVRWPLLLFFNILDDCGGVQWVYPDEKSRKLSDMKAISEDPFE